MVCIAILTNKPAPGGVEYFVYDEGVDINNVRAWLDYWIDEESYLWAKSFEALFPFTQEECFEQATIQCELRYNDRSQPFKIKHSSQGENANFNNLLNWIQCCEKCDICYQLVIADVIMT